ncbi:hypothetical protein ScPMuIL_011620 [Solemya velum]
MDFVYTLDYRSSKPSRDLTTEDKQICSLSCRNILALSRPVAGHALDLEKQNDLFAVEYEVYVFDLDKPWENFFVMLSSVLVTLIEWDNGGNRLLIADITGKCQIWQMEKHLLDKWKCVGESVIAGEEILAISWLHKGIQVPFCPEKIDSIYYNEKFMRQRLVPSLSQFGGKPVDGWIVVTATGLVHVGVLGLENTTITTATESLAPSHLRLSLADIAHNNNGEIMIATSDGLLTSGIQCFLVKLAIQHQTVSVSCKAGASLYAKTQIDYNNIDDSLAVTHLQFMKKENSDMIILACGNQSYSAVEVWHLIEQMMSLHQMFQVNASPEKTYKTQKWMHEASITHSSVVTSIAGPRLVMNPKYIEMAGPLPYFAVTYRDSVIKMIHRHSFQVINNIKLDYIRQQSQLSETDYSHKPGICFGNMIQTVSGCGLIGMDRGMLYLLRVFNGREGLQITLMPQIIILLLEYSIVVGHDWWDIFLAVRQGMIEGLSQRLTDNFKKQPQPMQDLTLMRFLSLKGALYNSSSVGKHRAADCSAMVVMHAISMLIFGILRPKSVSSQDKSPAEKLSILCSKAVDGDLDGLLLNLETEEFVVETRKRDRSNSHSEHALQSLQPLIQWFPLYQSYSTFPGSSLLTDINILETLRELLVVIRVWEVISHASFTVVKTSSYTDCLQHLFKLLTKLWLCCREGQGFEYDEALRDECCILPNKVLIPNINQSFPRDNMNCSLFSQSLPLSLKFGVEPDYLYDIKTVELYAYHGDSTRFGTEARHCSSNTSRQEAFWRCPPVLQMWVSIIAEGFRNLSFAEGLGEQMGPGLPLWWTLENQREMTLNNK